MGNNKLLNNGFTMLELIMTMAIIGVLAGMFIVNYPGVQRNARDTQRKSDLKQYQNALEVYANNNDGLYPTTTGNIQPNSDILCVTALGFASGDCPKDPRDGRTDCSSNTCRYFYRSDTSTQYVLWGALEKPVNNDYWIVCSTGQSGENNAQPTDSNCPL